MIAMCCTCGHRSCARTIRRGDRGHALPLCGLPSRHTVLSLAPGWAVLASVCPQPPPASLDGLCPPLSSLPLSLNDVLPVGEWKVVTILCCALVAPAVQGEQRCLETWQRRLHTLQELAHHEAQE